MESLPILIVVVYLRRRRGARQDETRRSLKRLWSKLYFTKSLTRNAARRKARRGPNLARKKTTTPFNAPFLPPDEKEYYNTYSPIY